MTNQLKRYGLIGLALLAAGSTAVATIAGRSYSSPSAGTQGIQAQAEHCAGLNRDGTYFVKQNASLPDGRKYCKVLTYDRPGGKVIGQSVQNPCPECPAPKAP